MKKLLIVVLLTSVFLVEGYSQVIRDLEMVSPFQEELASVKKGELWGFIDPEGQIVIDFREDLVSSPDASGLAASPDLKEYPVFVEGRCLVRSTVDGIEYFGFIDKNGKVVVEPKYVNATNFSNGLAIVTEYIRQVVGKNELLGKDVVNYQVQELVIDKDGKVVTSLMNARNYVPKKMKGSPPEMQARFLGPKIVAVKGEDLKWSIYKL